jgi:DNA polymerase I-like protein with 3'-5' exonuclease and polymerase domains
MPSSGCRRYLGVQEMEEAQRGCRVSHPRNPAEVVKGRTILGRRRLINPEASNWDRFQAKTNLVVQGACADGLKLALCKIHKALSKDAKIIATVHDEIIVEAPEAEAEQVKKLLAKIMVSVFGKLFKKTNTNRSRR